MKRRLVLYSGGQERRNALLHEQVLQLCARRRRVRMTYIPVWSENAETYYRRFVRRYRAYGASDFDCLPIDEGPLDPARVRRVLRSDVVYLAGGNTFYYLKHLRRGGLLPALRRYVARGGVLAGLSAGALIMTPNIALAGYPSWDRDENDVGLRNLNGLGLVRFEFFPHYTRSRRLRDALLRYSRRSRYPVYACRDGSGVVVLDDRFTAHGEVVLFHRGQMLPIA